MPPTGLTSPSCSARRSLGCSSSGSSPISSRNSVPPSAATNRPRFGGVGAGERAAHVAEQLALEQRADERAAVDRDERRRLARRPAKWSARATSSLPVPLSPVISTVASDCATLSIVARSCCIAGDSPIIEPYARRLVSSPCCAAQLVLVERALRPPGAARRARTACRGSRARRASCRAPRCRSTDTR